MTKSNKPNFYTPEEYRLQGSGSTYDLNLDNAIIQSLSTNEKLSNHDLKIKIENLLSGRSIGSSTYIEHLKRLNEVGILRKDEHGIGKKVEYSLTEDAIKQVRLNLLGVPRNKIILFRNIYQTILFRDISESLPIMADSEEKFDQMILAELRINKMDLQWMRVSTGDNCDSIDLVYFDRSENDRRVFIKKYWAEREGESIVLENIEHMCYPLASKGNLDIVLKRIEYWQINKHSDNVKYNEEYLCELPGFSQKEVLESGRFKDDDVILAFNALRELGLIKPAIEFQGKTRFIISDKKLHEFLINIWTIHKAEISYLVEKWKYFDAPTPEEKDRITSLFGEQEATRLFRQLELARSYHNIYLKKFKTAEEYIGYIKKNNTDFLWTLAIDSELDDFKGEYIGYIKKECSDPLWALAIDSELDDFKEKVRGNKKLVTDEERKDDLYKFVKFRKEKLYNHLKYLPANYEYEGIDDLKMDYSDTLRKYLFFQPVLKEICPKAFEAIDESESKVEEQNISPIEKKRKSSTVTRKKIARGTDNKHSPSKSKKIVKIPYELMKVYNRQNNTVEEVVVPDFTDI
jgi:hypothetical protein